MLALLDLVERRLRDVDVAALDQDRHLAIEERQQQGAYVRAVDVGIRIVAAQSAHTGDEVFVTFDRKIVDVPVARRHFFDLENRQRHQVTVDHLEISLASQSRRRQELVQFGGARMVLPNASQYPQVFFRRDADDPMPVLGLAWLTVHLSNYAVGFPLGY